MSKDLVHSQVDRQNILNNSYAIEQIQKQSNYICTPSIWQRNEQDKRLLTTGGAPIETIRKYIENQGG